jgi:charged multivesicular body protein 3
MRIAGSMKTSTEVMKAMSNLIKIPELQKTMTELGKEMLKAGIIDELIEETIDSALDAEDIDSAADAEVDKIILEITQGKLKDLPDLNPADRGQATASAVPDEEEEEEPEEEMTKRLEALKS